MCFEGLILRECHAIMQAKYLTAFRLSVRSPSSGDKTWRHDFSYNDLKKLRSSVHFQWLFLAGACLCDALCSKLLKLRTNIAWTVPSLLSYVLLLPTRMPTNQPTNHLVAIQEASCAGLRFSLVDDPFLLSHKPFLPTKCIARMWRQRGINFNCERSYGKGLDVLAAGLVGFVLRTAAVDGGPSQLVNWFIFGGKPGELCCLTLRIRHFMINVHSVCASSCRAAYGDCKQISCISWILQFCLHWASPATKGR